MFGQPYIKNRRFTPKEFEEELNDAYHWRRRPRYYIHDKPDYDIKHIEPLVNFSVNFTINLKD